MRKNLLIVLAFLSLTAFDIKKVEAPKVENVTENKSFYIKPIPKILTPTEGKIVAKKGQTIQIRTTAAGEPTPTSIVWFRYGVNTNAYELKDTDRISIDKLGANVTITIKDAKKSDSGIYEISYMNVAGSASVWVTVEVKEKPAQL